MDGIGPQERRGLLSGRADAGAPGRRRSDTVVLAIAFVGLAGSALLGSPARSGRAWPHETVFDSFLERVVWLLSLGYAAPTLRGVEAKFLLVSLIAGGLLLWAAARAVRRRIPVLSDWHDAAGDAGDRLGPASLSVWAVAVLIGWSLASALWARDAAIALGATWVMAIGWLWAAGLALNGRRELVRPLIDVLLAATALTSVLSLWYWFGRAAEVRLGWPLGNPLSLASVMVPTIVLGVGRAAEQIERLRHAPARAPVVRLVLYGLCVVLAAFTLVATGSRGALVAVAIGLAGGAWLTLGARARVAWALVGLLAATLAAPAGADWLLGAGGGRDASARMRLYAWRDAVRMGWEKPSAGYGAGAYTLLGTWYSLREAAADPLAMSGQVSSHAHSEPLELFSGLGVFGLLLGLAVWGFALVAAASLARGADRWLAAAVAGAIVAAFLDAATGVSWRLPGPGAFLATPAALAWMLWRQRGPAARPATGRVDVSALIVAALGAALAVGGICDSVAARYLYQAQAAIDQAGSALARREPSGGEPAAALAGYAVRRGDRARMLHWDPPRRLVAWLGSGQMRETLAYASVTAQPGDAATLAAAQRALDEGVALLERMEAVAPAYGDARWRIAELYDGKAGLAQQAGDAQQAQGWRQAAVANALAYLKATPLDVQRIWRAFAAWPEIPAEQRLRLLRSTLREEAQVWRAVPALQPPFQRWLEQHTAVDRLWTSLGAQGEAVANEFLAAGYAALQIPHRDWPDPLAPEGIRLAAARLVVAGKPAAAAGIREAAVLLYQQADPLLAYSLAATHLELAADRMRQGAGQVAMARAALAQAQEILRPLPTNAVHRRLDEVAAALRQVSDVVAGAQEGVEPGAWRAAVELLWAMPAAAWPERIEAWAQQADDALAARGEAPITIMELALGRGDAQAVRAQVAWLVGRGVGRLAIETALRRGGYRWPARQELAAALIRELPAD